MKQRLLFILFFTVSINSFSQAVISKQNTIGGSADDQLGGSWPTSDGGVVLGGRSYSTISGEKTETNNGVDDYWLVKLDKMGNIQWQRTFGGNDVDEILALAQTKDGGYILTGNSVSYPSGDKADNKGAFDFWVIKLNSFGSMEWQRALGGNSYEFCNSVQQTKDGGYLIGGSSVSDVSGDKSEYSRGGYDFWIVKLNSNGDKLWDKTIGGSGDEFLCKAIETRDGGYFLGGISTSNISGEKSENSRGNNDFWAVKLDKNRNKVWDKTAGGTDNDYVNGLVQTPDGGYVLSGASASNISGEKTENSKGMFDYWIVKLSKNGQVQFDKTIGGSSYEFEATVDNTVDTGLIIAGNSSSNISGDKTENSRGDYDIWVVKLNKYGKISWDKTLGGNASDNVRSIQEIKKDRFFIGGSSASEISGEKSEASRGGLDYWQINLNYKPVAETAVAADQNNIKAETQTSKGFNAFPNPAKDIINVQVNMKSIISITDISGKVLLTQNVEGKSAIDVSRLIPGIYYLKNITSGDAQKIVITR